MAPTIRVTGGDRLDPRGGWIASPDLWISGGRIIPTQPGPATHTLDAGGCLVVPGLIDLHTHVFAGQDGSVEMDEVGPPNGVTTFVDAGSAGAHIIGAFLRSIADRHSHLVAFLNVSAIGITAMRLAGESATLAYCSVDEAVAAVERHRDAIVGIKVRSSGNVVGTSLDAPFLRALEIADRTDLPLMVHIGPSPPDISWMLSRLRAGDILTHCFTGYDNRIVDDGRFVDGVLDARSRGVLFDVGHGAGGFDAQVAAAALGLGFPPDTLSTDIHAYSRDKVGGLNRVMTLFLALGMPLADILEAVTTTPAGIIGRHARLAPGDVADVAVLRVVDGSVELTDPAGHTLRGHRSIRTAATITDGDITFLDARLLGR